MKGRAPSLLVYFAFAVTLNGACAFKDLDYLRSERGQAGGTAGAASGGKRADGGAVASGGSTVAEGGTRDESGVPSLWAELKTAVVCPRARAPKPAPRAAERSRSPELRATAGRAAATLVRMPAARLPAEAAVRFRPAA